jgi:putative ABC transport system ATP-binding protein
VSRGVPILRTERLSRLYPDGRVQALVEATLEIHAGEYVAVTGPSGSGKSTLLNLLGSLDRPTSGTVFFDGRPLPEVGDLAAYRAEHVGFVFQSFYLLPTLTAAENVQIPMFECLRSPSQRSRRAAELLELVGMSHRARHLPGQLSVGERQRVAVARSLANEPEVLLADEPTGNLDTQSADGILDLFDRLHREQQTTLVVVTHSDTVAGRAERTIHLRDGRIVNRE